MKYGFYFLLATMVLSVLVGILTNCFSKSPSAVKKDSIKFSNLPLLKTPSICNAMEINQTISSKNGPVRPEGESYSDGLISEIGITRKHTSPENLLINIRDQVSKPMVNQDGR